MTLVLCGFTCKYSENRNQGTAMGTTELQAALSQLKSFDQARNPPGNFLYFSANFCDVLADSPLQDELRRQAHAFVSLTGPGSTFEEARSRLARLCVTDSPLEGAEEDPGAWCNVEPGFTIESFREAFGTRFLAPDLARASHEASNRKTLLPIGASPAGVSLRWWCVGSETIHDIEWVRCNLHSLFAITESTVRSGVEFHPPEANEAFVQFRDQIWRVWRKADQEHLLGSYLLLACQEAVNAGSEACRKVVQVLTELDVQSKAACDAAEALCRDREALGGEAPSPSSVTIRQVTVSFQGTGVVLRAVEVPAFAMTPDETTLFMPFVLLIASETTSATVNWRTINGSLKEDGPEWYHKQHPRVSKNLSLLNKRLRTWGVTPDGEVWIGTKQGKNGGRLLNQSVQWAGDAKDDLVRSLKRKSLSDLMPLIDPKKMAEATPDRDHELPALPRRDHRRAEDEDR